MELWSALTDLESLKRCLRNCEKLEAVWGKEFAARLAIRIGRIDRVLESKATVADADPPNAAELVGAAFLREADSFRWRARLTLQPDHEGTLLTYAVDVDPSGHPSILRGELEAAARGLLEHCLSA